MAKFIGKDLIANAPNPLTGTTLTIQRTGAEQFAQQSRDRDARA